MSIPRTSQDWMRETREVLAVYASNVQVPSCLRALTWVFRLRFFPCSPGLHAISLASQLCCGVSGHVSELPCGALGRRSKRKMISLVFYPF